MITFHEKGNFLKTENYLQKIKKQKFKDILKKYAQDGVSALSSATPKDSGETSKSWYYKIEEKNGEAVINFCNSNIKSNVPIAVIIQYGHGTGSGGYVQGIDYINPSLRPIFETMADSAWKEVTKL